MQSLVKSILVISMKTAGLWREAWSTVCYANLLALNDLSLRYASSALGPFWITGQMLFFVLGLGFVFSSVFNTPLAEFLPFLAISITFWTFFSGCINEATSAILDGGSLIKDRAVSPQTFVMKVYIRNIYMLAHNILVPFMVFVVFQKYSFTNFLLAVPGILLFILIAGLMMAPVALFAVRFRDFKPFVESLIQLTFLVTPIMWRPDLLVNRTYVVDYNPLAVLFSLWREPLLKGEMADAHNWVVGLGVLLGAALLNRLAARSYRNCVFWI
ncbi:MAG: glycosyl hydrolase [Betaproteobacteria bacterium]|nr:glycosyl hydrolase [Betaproteobacteria bacterium]